MNKTKTKSGSQKRAEKRMLELLAAGADKKQRKLDFSKTKNNPTVTKQVENTSIAALKDEGLPLPSTSTATSFDYLFMSTQTPNKSENLSEVSEKEDCESDFEYSDDSLSEENDENEGEIASMKNIPLFIPPSLGSNVQTKKQFVDEHPCQPQLNIPFPAQKVYFRKMPDGSYLERKWLTYNELTSKIHCSVCMGFSSPGSPFVEGLKVNIKHLYKQLDKHEISSSHESSYSSYLKVALGETVQHKLCSYQQKIVEQNRDIFTRIIEIAVFIGKQGLAFRSKRNEASYCLSAKDTNQGNFLELVKLVAKFDPVLEAHLGDCIKKSSANKHKQIEKGQSTCGRGSLVTFLSKTTVNKIFYTIGTMIKAKIAEEVVAAGYFSIEVDSSQDTSVMDQLCICLRYVLNGKIHERMISMVESNSGTGEELFEIVKKRLNDLGISLAQLIGKSFDGAANMSGKYNGLQAHLSTIAPGSIFTHCHAHVLNLIISQATSCCPAAQDLFTLLQKTAVFFSESYKRTGIWKQFISESEKGQNKMRKLQKLGTTRWGSKDDALKSIFHSWLEPEDKRSRFKVLLKSLHYLGSNSSINSSTASEARFLLEKWTSFSTIMTSFLFLEIFHYTSAASTYLQSKGIDYICVASMISSLITNLKNTSYEKLKDKVHSFILHINKSDKYGIQENFPEKRLAKIKKMPGELSSDEIRNVSNNDLYRIKTYRVVYDTVFVSMEERISKNKPLYKILGAFDPKNFEDLKPQGSEGGLSDSVDFNESINFIAHKAKVDPTLLKEEFFQFAPFYINHYSSTSTISSTSHLLGKKESTSHDLNCKNCPSCVLSFIYTYNLHSATFSNLYIAYKYILTLSITQVNCERAFSKLKIIKTRLRSTMNEELLESLMLISVESDLVPSTNIILDNIGRSSKTLSKYFLF